MMDTFRKAYHLVALLALIHLLGLAGGAALLVTTGRLTPQRVRAVVDVLGGEAPGAEESVPDAGEQGEMSNAPAQPPAPGSVAEELARRNLERVVMEANQRLILANRQMIEVKRRREELEKQEAERAQLHSRQAEESAKEGFKKDLEILSVLKPKVALDSLLTRPIDDAARMVMAMDARTSKKIIEAAQKDPRKRTAMLAIQRSLRDLSTGESGNEEIPTLESQ